MCGVFGIRSAERDVARIAYFGLFALQHRGQESAGIAVSDHGRVTALRDMGLVTQVFDEQKLRGLRGQLAIGHTRYSTTGSTHWANAQPIVQHGRARTVALGHNGNLTNAADLRAELAAEGLRLRSSSDTEVIAALVAGGEAPLEDAVAAAMARLDGPDSGTPAAIGFARATGIPFSEGLIKNRYVGRTFIEPDQGLREQGIRLKFNPLAEVAGKRVVAVDDSIVRGNTTRQIVAMLFDAGAAEVHVRVSSPPIVGPCFYGIDFAAEDELVAAARTVEEVPERIGATSLAYLSLEGLQAATRRPASALCRACLTRDYPTRVPVELKLSKRRLEPSPAYAGPGKHPCAPR